MACWKPKLQLLHLNSWHHPHLMFLRLMSLHLMFLHLMSLHLMFLIALREKQLVPYIFFQKGLCLKGDRCAFLHGPNPTRNKIPQVPVAAPYTEPPSLKKVFGGLENRTQEQRFLQPSFSKSFKVPRPAIPTTKKLELLHQNTQLALTKLQCHLQACVMSYLGTKQLMCPLPAMGTLLIDPIGCINLMYKMITVFRMVVLDVDGFYRESSPSFDVLIDENLRDFDYYHDEHHFGGERRWIER